MRTKSKDKELNHRHFIGLRLTDVELDLLDQGAACLSISRSEYLRKLLLEKQINHQIEVVADMNDLRKLVSEYGKIGSNLNQIAKHFNSSESQSHAVKNEIHQCITDLFQLRKEVLKLAGGMDGLNCDPMSFDKTRYYLVGYTLDKPYSLRLDYTPLAGRTSHALYAKWCIRICQSTCYCSYNHRI